MSLASKFGNRVRTISQQSYKSNSPENRRTQRKSNLFKEGVSIIKPRLDIQEQVRLCPFLDFDYIVMPLKSHYDMGPDHSSFPCPKTKGEDCSVCGYGSKLWAEGKQSIAPKYWSKDGSMAYAIDRTHEELGPQVLKLSYTNEKSIRDLMEDENHAILPVNDLDAGNDLFFKLADNGKKIDGRAIKEVGSIKFARKPSPLGTEKQVGTWLDYIEANPLIEQLNWLSGEEMLAIAGIKENEEDEDEEGSPSEDESGDESESESEASESEPEDTQEEETKAASSASQSKLDELRRKMANKSK